MKLKIIFLTLILLTSACMSYEPKKDTKKCFILCDQTFVGELVQDLSTIEKDKFCECHAIWSSYHVRTQNQRYIKELVYIGHVSIKDPSIYVCSTDPIGYLACPDNPGNKNGSFKNRFIGKKKVVLNG